MQKKPRKPLTPEAAKILEQYRSAGKAIPGVEGDLDPDGNAANPSKPNAAPPAASRIPRSGTRGK